MFASRKENLPDKIQHMACFRLEMADAALVLSVYSTVELEPGGNYSIPVVALLPLL